MVLGWLAFLFSKILVSICREPILIIFEVDWLHECDNNVLWFFIFFLLVIFFFMLIHVIFSLFFFGDVCFCSVDFFYVKKKNELQVNVRYCRAFCSTFATTMEQLWNKETNFSSKNKENNTQLKMPPQTISCSAQAGSFLTKYKIYMSIIRPHVNGIKWRMTW